MRVSPPREGVEQCRLQHARVQLFCAGGDVPPEIPRHHAQTGNHRAWRGVFQLCRELQEPGSGPHRRRKASGGRGARLPRCGEQDDPAQCGDAGVQGHALFYAGQLDAAFQEHEAVRKETFGEDEVRTLHSYYACAVVLQAMGRFEDAE